MPNIAMAPIIGPKIQAFEGTMVTTSAVIITDAKETLLPIEEK
jgi:hypothetical protein